MGEQSGKDQGFRILSILASGLLLYGGLGWLADRWLQTTVWLPVGIILGTAAGLYLVVVKFGRST